MQEFGQLHGPNEAASKLLPPLASGHRVESGVVHAISPEGITITTGTFPIRVTQVQAIGESKELGRGRLPAARFASLTGLTPGTQLTRPNPQEVQERQLQLPGGAGGR